MFFSDGNEGLLWRQNTADNEIIKPRRGEKDLPYRGKTGGVLGPLQRNVSKTTGEKFAVRGYLRGGDWLIRRGEKSRVRGSWEK